VHLTFDEPILTRPVARQVSPQYAEIHPFKTKAYSKKEIVAEKMRALLQQQGKWPRPRDLYDLWFILCRSKEDFDRSEIRELFVKKCQARQIEPDLQGLISKNLKEWNRGVWNNLLGPMLKTVPAYDDVWSEWTRVFRNRYL
jgi:predicted nucleotidyltransferase component of viral defense system